MGWWQAPGGRGSTLAGAALGLLLGACIARSPFACDDDAQCQRGDQPGLCAAPGYCAYLDDTCDSGWRFDRFAAADLAESCVEPPSASSTGSPSGSDASTSNDATSTTAGSESTTGPPIPDEICDGRDNDGDGLIDEWSPVNETCNGCVLHQEAGRAYWRCDRVARWSTVQSLCLSFGANLATVDTPAENLVLLFLLGDAGAGWIGINDIGDPGNFTWIDGSPVDFTLWRDGIEPGESPDADCGGLTSAADWVVFNCLNSRPGICEAPHPD